MLSLAQPRLPVALRSQLVQCVLDVAHSVLTHTDTAVTATAAAAAAAAAAAGGGGGRLSCTPLLCLVQ